MVFIEFQPRINGATKTGDAEFGAELFFFIADCYGEACYIFW
jgi:hypothetical protein